MNTTRCTIKFQFMVATIFAEFLIYGNATNNPNPDKTTHETTPNLRVTASTSNSDKGAGSTQNYDRNAESIELPFDLNDSLKQTEYDDSIQQVKGWKVTGGNFGNTVCM